MIEITLNNRHYNKVCDKVNGTNHKEITLTGKPVEEKVVFCSLPQFSEQEIYGGNEHVSEFNTFTQMVLSKTSSYSL